jgi:hypothetical protein
MPTRALALLVVLAACSKSTSTQPTVPPPKPVSSVSSSEAVAPPPPPPAPPPAATGACVPTGARQDAPALAEESDGQIEVCLDGGQGLCWSVDPKTSVYANVEKEHWKWSSPAEDRLSPTGHAVKICTALNACTTVELAVPKGARVDADPSGALLAAVFTDGAARSLGFYDGTGKELQRIALKDTSCDLHPRFIGEAVRLVAPGKCDSADANRLFDGKTGKDLGALPALREDVKPSPVGGTTWAFALADGTVATIDLSTGKAVRSAALPADVKRIVLAGTGDGGVAVLEPGAEVELFDTAGAHHHLVPPVCQGRPTVVPTQTEACHSPGYGAIGALAKDGQSFSFCTGSSSRRPICTRVDLATHAFTKYDLKTDPSIDAGAWPALDGQAALPSVRLAGKKATICTGNDACHDVTLEGAPVSDTTSVVVAADGTLALNTAEDTIATFDATGKHLADVKIPKFKTYTEASADFIGDRLLVAATDANSGEGRAALHDPKTGALVARLPDDFGPTYEAHVLVGGDVWALTAMGAKDLLLVDVKTGKVQSRSKLPFKPEDGTPVPFAMSDGRLLLFQNASAAVSLFDPKTKKIETYAPKACH